MTEARCEDCLYWQRVPVAGRVESWAFFCHRYPISVPKRHDEWCGEWLEREPQPWDVEQR